MNIRLFKPSLGKEELAEIEKAFDASWVGLGPKVSEFEKKWTEFIGCRQSLGLNSATAALHLALQSFNFPEGKKVLVPSMTFSATATSILYNNLTPIFVDSDPVTLGLDMNDLKQKYDEDCVAIMAVHYAGHPLPMDDLVPWARKRNLKIIEDCAHCAGGSYKGKFLGTWGDIGCFSFEEKKLMTTGDGGMICSNNPELLKDIKARRWVGIDKDNWKTAKSYTDVNEDAMHWFYEVSLLGYKYNMNDLAASIGLVQLGKLPLMNRRRSDIIKKYVDGIKGIDQIDLLLPYEPEENVYWLFGIRCDQRDDLILHLKSKGIATGCHYTPLSLQPLFKKYSSKCDYIEKEHARLITLPLHSDLTDKEIDYIIESLNDFKN